MTAACRSTLLILSGLSGPLAASALAADNVAHTCAVANLRNGFSISYERREAAGAATRLWLCSGSGYVEIPSAEIETFQPVESVAAPAEAASRLPAAGSTETAGPNGIQHLIATAALRHRIDPDFVASVAKAESGFKAGAVSDKGAQGVMQLMPQTAAELGVEDPLNPAANVEGGTKYLRQLLDKYDGDPIKALAAYNAGPHRVEQYGGVPPYRETQAYVARVIDDYSRRKLQRQSSK